jgi:predicted DNA-binding transcriptional regulator AlpA
MMVQPMAKKSDHKHSLAPAAISELPELIRPAQLAAALGVAKTTIWRWSKGGNGPKRIAIGGSVFFAREDISQWINAHKRDGL